VSTDDVISDVAQNDDNKNQPLNELTDEAEPSVSDKSGIV
jgi:hypothetical protein